ncbi:MAG TPA: tetratricopeptide repeat protein [Pseudomonadota bacterium]|nr:tetratricopeptide repeat protein [Pseudomonadota bacterium]
MNDPTWAELSRIRDLIGQGQHDEALQTVIALQQTLEGVAGAQAFLLRGLALAGLGQPDRAERSFRTAYSIVRYAPVTEILAQRILAEAAERIGRREEAIAAYQAVLAANPDDAGIKAALAKLQPSK